MHLKQISYFVVVALAKIIFQKRWKDLMFTNPRDLNIKSLEEELGVRLFNRAHKSKELSQAGSQPRLHAGKSLETSALFTA